MTYGRRQFLRDSGIGLLTFQLAGCDVEMTPEEAHESGASLQFFTESEALALGALGEVLLPGSKEMGLVEFVDQQLAAPFKDQMLMIKYLGPLPPFDDFYKGGLAAVDQVAKDSHGTVFADLNEEQQIAIVSAIAQNELSDWPGLPGPFFYFVIRNDAVDVTYGTKAGMEALGIPYMAHIEPPSNWGGDLD